MTASPPSPSTLAQTPRRGEGEGENPVCRKQGPPPPSPPVCGHSGVLTGSHPHTPVPPGNRGKVGTRGPRPTRGTLSSRNSWKDAPLTSLAGHRDATRGRGLREGEGGGSQPKGSCGAVCVEPIEARVSRDPTVPQARVEPIAVGSGSRPPPLSSARCPGEPRSGPAQPVRPPRGPQRRQGLPARDAARGWPRCKFHLVGAGRGTGRGGAPWTRLPRRAPRPPRAPPPAILGGPQ